MDFKRIELIFLCAFLSLNIFLLVTYRQGMIETAPIPETGNLAQIETRLKGDKIAFNNSFSQEVSEGYYLSAQGTRFPGTTNLAGNQDTRLNRRLTSSEQVPFTKSEANQELLNLVTKDDFILYSKDYGFLNESLPDSTKYVFTQKFEGLPFNDESSELSLEVEEMSPAESLVIGYSQSHLTEIDPLREKQEVISESAAIENLYLNNRIPSESKILKTQLAYSRIFTVRGKNVYIPAWFVWIETNKKNILVERINGFTNSIISSSVPEMKK
ncbi:two-component system regulatory protein YycI [Vagococcus salmoninarum]|uniref:Regulatory protein YycH-like domain-containing protein n=1 Tax=Vagococcus salmoninarum TaxID=2739 RepID=A0A429ZPZ6_9ENTE|nr:two-component system regulatory protein YycI [Vagococcus salmoninarum]MBE9390300.1 two-component system regulatory protein YycI [Vagococcus salmoninarum]RST95790.1 hypothetical protein CBF35_07455 [Vagococcus salmoninarum]